MNNRTLSAVTAGAFAIALAAGLIAYSLTGYGIPIILWTVMLIFGLVFLATSFACSRESGKFGPSEAAYRMAMGILVAVVGLAGMLYTAADMDVLILAAMVIIAVAAAGLAVALMNGKKEGQ